MANWFLITTILTGVWAWHRLDFRPPPFLRRMGIPPRRLITLAGWLIIGVTMLYLFGDIFGGYTARNLNQSHHVHRSDDPRTFWLQIFLQLAIYGGTGLCLIAFGRSTRRAVSEARH